MSLEVELAREIKAELERTYKEYGDLEKVMSRNVLAGTAWSEYKAEKSGVLRLRWFRTACELMGFLNADKRSVQGAKLRAIEMGADGTKRYLEIGDE